MTWENSISGLAESDVVRLNGFDKEDPFSGLIDYNGERILCFIGQNGFRAIRLSSLRRIH